MRCFKCDKFLVRAYGSQELSCDVCDVERKSRTSLYSLKGNEIVGDELPTKIIELSKSRQQMLAINEILNFFIQELEHPTHTRGGNYVFSEKDLQALLQRVFLAGMKQK